jgi:hypothetical protein
VLLRHSVCRRILEPYLPARQPSYVNYMNPPMANFGKAYWGGNYERLAVIKQKYDPLNVFTKAQTVQPTGGSRHDARVVFINIARDLSCLAVWVRTALRLVNSSTMPRAGRCTPAPLRGFCESCDGGALQAMSPLHKSKAFDVCTTAAETRSWRFESSRIVWRTGCIDCQPLQASTGSLLEFALSTSPSACRLLHQHGHHSSFQTKPTWLSKSIGLSSPHRSAQIQHMCKLSNLCPLGGCHLSIQFSRVCSALRHDFIGVLTLIFLTSL